MAVMSDQLNFFRRSSLALIGVLVLVSLATSARAQSQASCQFTTFNIRFSLNGGTRTLTPRGVNDYATVVGDALDDLDFSARGFARFSGGSISYYRHTTDGSPVHTYFTGRTNGGTTIGVAGPDFSPGTMKGTPFTLHGSTFTALAMRIGGIDYTKFTIWGMNRWGTRVGAYTDAAGKIHGFRSYSNGNAIALNYPGAAKTVASAINDNGTVVGSYTKNLEPNAWWHGFIYHNGQWATLNFPDSTQETTLSGISNANLIVGATVVGRSSTTVTGSFMYKNGTFKRIVMPNSNVPTSANGVSPGKGLITGASGFKGYVASCN
jgi:uncharacterized membrane protein